MTKTTRVVVTAVAALAVTGLTGGIASAAETAPAAPSGGVPIWLLPGVDLGPLLDPVIGLPAGVFGPIDGLLTTLGG